MPLTLPKTSAFKQFIILDADGVVSALSAIDGGQIDEVLTRSAEEKGGEGGGEVNLGGAKAGGKRAKSRKVEEEIRRARTRHATAAKLLETLHARESVGVVEGPLDTEVAEDIVAGMVLEFRAELRVHPLHQADQIMRSFVKVAPKFGEKKAATELQSVLGPWATLIGTDKGDGRLLIEPHTSEPQHPRLLLPVPSEDLEIELDDVLGEVTVVAQVERVLTEEETYSAIRLLRGAPNTSFERTAVEDGTPELLAGLREMGVSICADDVFIRGPALMLRAICAYR